MKTIFLLLLLVPSLSFSQVIRQNGSSAAELSASTFTASVCLRAPAAGTTFSAGCNSSTNVGVNTAAPAYPLDVSGAARITGQGIVGGTFTVQGTAFSVGGTTLTCSSGNCSFGGSTTLGASGTPLSVVSTMTYTPTLTNGANVAASTPYNFNCSRLGNRVSCDGQATIDPTSAGAFVIDISLPVASNFDSTTNGAANGVGVDGSVSLFGCVTSIANDRFTCNGSAAGTAAIEYAILLKYTVQ